MNGEKLQHTSSDTLSDSLLVTGFPYLHDLKYDLSFELFKEFYDQTRTLLVGTSLGYKSSLQGGISRSRVGNDEVVEFPLIFRYQATKGISAYLGVQGQVVRGLDTSGLMFTEFAPTMGIDVQFTPEWDAGIQFMAPVYQNSAAPAVSYELSHPIRLRTGIKF